MCLHLKLTKLTKFQRFFSFLVNFHLQVIVTFPCVPREIFRSRCQPSFAGLFSRLMFQKALEVSLGLAEATFNFWRFSGVVKTVSVSLSFCLWAVLNVLTCLQMQGRPTPYANDAYCIIKSPKSTTFINAPLFPQN